MVDIETLSTRSNALILTIGAIKFDLNGITPPLNEMDCFYQKIDIDSCKKYMHICNDTVKWWDSQDKAIIEEAFGGERLSLEQVIKDFTNWFSTSKYIWSHGACFDIPILDNAYILCGQKPPWKFSDVRDTRTIYDIGKVTSQDLPSDNKHHALYDCYRQIYGVQMAFKNIFQ